MRKLVGSSSFMRQGIRKTEGESMEGESFSVERGEGRERDPARGGGESGSERWTKRRQGGERAAPREKVLQLQRSWTLCSVTRGHPNAMSVEQLGTKAIGVQTRGGSTSSDSKPEGGHGSTYNVELVETPRIGNSKEKVGEVNRPTARRNYLDCGL
jgi:hypothetical protein